MLTDFIFGELPAIALISAAIYCAAYFIFKKRTGPRPLIRHAVLWAATCYSLSLVFLTLLWYGLFISFDTGYRSINLHPFIWLSETYEMGMAKMLEQLVLNIAMFVPMGLLLPVVFPRLRRFYKTALAALLATLLIEGLQYFMGRSADIDDVIMNLAGGMLGYLLFYFLERRFGGKEWWRKAKDG